MKAGHRIDFSMRCLAGAMTIDAAMFNLISPCQQSNCYSAQVYE